MQRPCALLVLALSALAAKADPAAAFQAVPTAYAVLARPAVEPCTVMLFRELAFTRSGEGHRMDAEPHGFGFQPPAACHGPWAKIVLEANFSVAAGRQFDRTASLWLGGVNLFYGTTQEPSADVGPTWHVERDVTDYAALFAGPQQGQVALNNFIGGVYSSAIVASAKLVFYPAGGSFAVAPTADVVYPLQDPAQLGPTALASGSDRLSRTLTLPRNVVAAYLDLIAQSQGNDEPWYTCVPDNAIADSAPFALEAPYDGAPVQQCNGGSFREVMVRIDDQPAGLAPVFPWTYTGGVDPHLWRPTPDVQTLNFMPYRVDLTPFAARLSDGEPHAISVQVLGANRFFNVAANLLVYRDPARAQVTGALSKNSLTRALAPANVHSTLAHAQGRVAGDLSTKADQHYVIEGYVDTAEGRRRTRIDEHLAFSNRQGFEQPEAHRYHQRIEQATETLRERQVWIDHRRVARDSTRWNYPLLLDVDKRVLADGSFIAAINMTQGYHRYATTAGGTDRLDDVVQATDTVHFNNLGNKVLDHRDQGGKHVVDFRGADGSCYHREVASHDEQPLRPIDGLGCAGQTNHVTWRSHPDGAP